MDLLLLLLLSSLSLSLDLLKKEKKSSGSILLRPSLSLSPFSSVRSGNARFWEKKKICVCCTYLRVFSSDEKWEKVEKIPIRHKKERERETRPILCVRERDNAPSRTEREEEEEESGSPSLFFRVNTFLFYYHSFLERERGSKNGRQSRHDEAAAGARIRTRSERSVEKFDAAMVSGNDDDDDVEKDQRRRF